MDWNRDPIFTFLTRRGMDWGHSQATGNHTTVLGMNSDLEPGVCEDVSEARVAGYYGLHGDRGGPVPLSTLHSEGGGAARRVGRCS